MTQPSDHDPHCQHDFTIRRLRERLRAEEAINDATWERGYREGLFDRESDIPEELLDALRYGSAQQQTEIPIGDDRLTIVLAQDGAGHPRGRSEARVWKTIRDLYKTLVEEDQSIDRICHCDLPEQLAAVLWRRGDKLTVVVNRSTRRAGLRGVLRCRTLRHSGGGALVAVAGWVVGREVLSRVVGPVVAATAVAATAAFVLVPNTDADSAPDHPAAHAPRAVATPSWAPNGRRMTPGSTTPTPGPADMTSPAPSSTADVTVSPQPAPSGTVGVDPSAAPSADVPVPLLSPEPSADPARQKKARRPGRVKKVRKAKKARKAVRPAKAARQRVCLDLVVAGVCLP